MIVCAPIRIALFALLTLLSLSVVGAPTARELCAEQFSPRSGQPGKDVIWVPTLDELVTAMLEAAKVGPNDYVVDLGSGDGKIPIMAAKKYGARAMGVEYNPQMVQLARCYVRAEGLGSKVQIVHGDIFATDFSHATVLTLYLLSDLNLKLRPRILQLRPGTRVVSNTFKMGDWSPDEFIESTIGNTRAYLWIVPAKLAGTWDFVGSDAADRFSIRIDQHYQELKVSPVDTASTRVKEARLRGTSLTMTLSAPAAVQLKGTVDGDSIELRDERQGGTAQYRGTRRPQS